MAKSARASVTKANRTRFRQNITGPGELARAQRLSAKLQEVASKPKPDHEEKAAEAATTSTDPKAQAKADTEAMEIDSISKTSRLGKSTSRTSNRIQKKRRGKERNQIAFKSTDHKSRATRKGKK